MYLEIRGRYKECIRMLNGLEKTLERKVPERERHWQLAEERAVYGVKNESIPQAGFPLTPETKKSWIIINKLVMHPYLVPAEYSGRISSGMLSMKQDGRFKIIPELLS